jgi:hypothetical protein
MTTPNLNTPPPELVDQWSNESPDTVIADLYLATRAAQWGADQELEECCEWAINDFDLPIVAEQLRAARRPKPPSLKEEAMQALCRFMAGEGHDDCTEEEIEDDFKTIRRALEALDD